jgi:hypothetical protein
MFVCFKYSALSLTSFSFEFFTLKGIVVSSTFIAHCIFQSTLWKDLSPVKFLAKPWVSKESSKVFFLFGYTPLFLLVLIKFIWVMLTLCVWLFGCCLVTCMTLLVCYNYVWKVVCTWITFEPMCLLAPPLYKEEESYLIPMHTIVLAKTYSTCLILKELCKWKTLIIIEGKERGLCTCMFGRFYFLKPNQIKQLSKYIFCYAFKILIILVSIHYIWWYI